MNASRVTDRLLRPLREVALERATADTGPGALLRGYGFGDAYDEMFEGPQRPRPHYELLHRRLSPLAPDEFRRRKAMTDLSMLQDGVGFTVYRQEEGIERVWPMDPVPRIIPAQEWRHIEQGLVQRLLTLNLFLKDIYHEQFILRDRVLDPRPPVESESRQLDDLIAAVEQILTPSLKQKRAERAAEVRKFSEWAKSARAQVVNNPDWDQSPIISDRLTWEIAQFADPDAIIVHEAGSVALHSFDFDPMGGRELFYYYGAHLGSGVGTAAGVKLARPNQQVICLVGDGSFVFGSPVAALWAAQQAAAPFLTLVMNNGGYNASKMPVLGLFPDGASRRANAFPGARFNMPPDYAALARSCHAYGERVEDPAELPRAIERGLSAVQAGQAAVLDVVLAQI